MYVKVGGWHTKSALYVQVMTPTETRRSAGHLFHEVNLVELANGPGLDNVSWRTVSAYVYYVTIMYHNENKFL